MTEHTAESDAATCGACGRAIVQMYAGTFWKAPDPMPMMWVHADTRDRACGYATPYVLPPGSGRTEETSS